MRTIAASVLFGHALVGTEAAGKGHWFYKSYQSCTNSDSHDTKKCRADAQSVKCWGDVTSMSCAESDKASCAEIGRSITTANPNGFGFMCPHLMLGTREMQAAAHWDAYDGTYGVVTIDALKCGQCVELTNTDSVGFPLAPKIKAQIFNSVADSVDVYMAGGGLGAFNGCNKVGDYSPMADMYEKYPTARNPEFVKYMESIGYSSAATQLDKVMQWSGGIRGGRTYADCRKQGGSANKCQPPGNGCNGGGGMCIQDPEEACKAAFKGRSDWVTQKALESCHYVFEHDLHWNRPITYTVVPCPKSLTSLTGLVPADGDDEEILQLPQETVTSSTTTMEDCCEPTCSREPATKGKGTWKKDFDALYTCNAHGEVYYEHFAPKANPCGKAGENITFVV